ncbi:MAG TPA: hypothetical protein VK308_07985, partial [Pyrinomonadaceae bacterium]|nr:hypothetical protein [Pyrinomonadaceae bacterium]
MKSKTMISNAGSSGKRAGERGGASVIVIFLMLFATAVATSSVVNRYRETRSREASQTRLRENWEAKSAVAVLDRVIKNRLPAQNLRDLEFAVNDCDADPGLAAFDAQNVPLENSRPVATVGGTPSCTESVSNTSLLGNINSYLLIRQAYLQSEVAAFGYSQDQVRITTLEESVRRFTTGLPPVFQIHYVLDARGGRFGAVRFEGDVVLGTASQSCGTTAVISANRAQIQSGENVTLTISYSMAKNLKIYEANGGTLIHEVNVSESAAPQNYTYTFKPTATNSYRVKATGATADCTSESTAVPVVVSAPSICASNPPKINAYGASSMLVNAGEEIFLVWQTSGSISTVTLNG